MKFSVVAFLPMLALAQSNDPLLSMDVTARFAKVEHAPSKSAAQMCLMKSFKETHNYISHDKVWELADAWVLPQVGGSRLLRNAAVDNILTMDFRGLVRTDEPTFEDLVPAPAPKLAQPHGGSCGPTCPPDDDEEEEEEEEVVALVPAPAPKLTQPHGGSCGPTCPPDDDEEEEEEVVVVLVPAPAPKLSQPHGGSCGPTCPPDDDEEEEEEEEVVVVLVPAPAPKLSQPHGGSCGPTCPPDDDEEEEELVVLIPAPAPALMQPHGGSCGPTCPPDDDEDEFQVECEFCPPIDRDAMKMNEGDLARMAAHIEWEELFCSCLDAEDPTAQTKGCALTVQSMTLDMGSNIAQ